MFNELARRVGLQRSPIKRHGAEQEQVKIVEYNFVLENWKP